MKSVVYSVVLAVLAGLASCKVALTNSNYDNIEAGESFTITWSGNTGPITLTLKNGPEGNLKTVSTITSGATGGSFVWTPDASLVSGQYAFEITDGADVNYSPQFALDGGAASSSAVPSSTSSTVTRSSASASQTSSTVSSTSTTASASTTSGSSSSATTASSTSSKASTSTSSAAPSSTTPPSNGAQGVVAPIVAPLLMVAGAAALL